MRQSFVWGLICLWRNKEIRYLLNGAPWKIYVHCRKCIIVRFQSRVVRVKPEQISQFVFCVDVC